MVSLFFGFPDYNFEGTSHFFQCSIRPARLFFFDNVVSIRQRIGIYKCMHLYSFSLSLALSPNCEKRQLASSYLSVRLSVFMHVCLYVCLSVCLSVRMQLLDSHWTKFHEISYLIIFSKLLTRNSSFIKIRQEHGLPYNKKFLHL